MTRCFRLVFILTLCAAPLAAAAGDKEDLCRARARAESGVRGGPAAQTGGVGVQMRLGGSAALGVSKSTGPGPAITPPPFAGATAAERHEDARARKREEAYRRVFARCMGDG